MTTTTGLLVWLRFKIHTFFSLSTAFRTLCTHLWINFHVCVHDVDVDFFAAAVAAAAIVCSMFISKIYFLPPLTTRQIIKTCTFHSNVCISCGFIYVYANTHTLTVFLRRYIKNIRCCACMYLCQNPILILHYCGTI